MVRFLWAALIATSGLSPAWGLDLRFDPPPTPEEAPAFEAFLDEVRRTLPPRALERFEGPVRLKFKEFDRSFSLAGVCAADPEAEKSTMGQHMPKSRLRDHDEILIHELFRRQILKGPSGGQDLDCRQSHGTYYRLALGTVVHELGHVLDNGDYFSGTQQYLKLANWSSGIFGDVFSKNTLREFSPNFHEFDNPAESFAVNFEHFAMDPDFVCRRPGIGRFMVAHFGGGKPREACDIYRKVFLNPTGPTVAIDPSRVYEIDYLFAGPGQETMSRWGHAMFRLVICAPETPFGPACRKDVGHHVVVSYRANIADTKIDKLKGLTGGYPSNIFFYTFASIVQEYTEDELRDLMSLPLALSQEQKDILLDHVLEHYWTYQGRYYFITNNCATEANDTVVSAVGYKDSSAISPSGLYDDLHKAGLIDRGLLEPRSKAIGAGFLFPSAQPRYDAMFRQLKKNIPAEKFPYRSLDDFMEKSKALERRRMLEGAASRDAAALYVLERHMSLSIQHGMAKKAYEIIDNNESWSEESRAHVQDGVEKLALLKPSSQIEADIYGVPGKGDVRSEGQTAQYRIAFMGALKRLVDAMRRRFPEPFRELIASEENMRRFAWAARSDDPRLQ